MKKRKGYQRQERALGREGFRQTEASGSGNTKGDNLNETYLISAKHTVHRQFALKLSDLATMEHDACKEDRIPLMQICLGPSEEKYCVLRWSDARAMLPGFPTEE